MSKSSILDCFIRYFCFVNAHSKTSVKSVHVVWSCNRTLHVCYVYLCKSKYRVWENVEKMNLKAGMTTS